MPGHLFITRGDIRHIACNAWLLPTARDLKVESIWTRGDRRLRSAIEGDALKTASERCPGWKDGSVRAMPFLPREGVAPAVWLGNVGGHRSTDVGWIVEAVTEFVERAEATTESPPTGKRDRSLLAIPLVGTRAGGKAHEKGKVAKELVKRLAPTLARADSDVVLVTYGPEALAAAQRARRLHWGEGWPNYWRRTFADAGAALPLEDPYALGRDLAAHARRGKLVLFVGAGVGAGAGLPQWTELLDALAADVALSSEDLEDLAIVDRATVIATALSAREQTVGDAVVRHLPDGPYALAHSLVANLPSTEIITTNYDRRLEEAADDADKPFMVLDERSVAGADRWLLKLHGSVGKPEQIVLTRDDYLGYGHQRAALRGVVQAMLITRHMLFVGFGLSDDNFHAIAHDVRTALGTTSRPQAAVPFGTALLVHERPLFDQLWKGDIRQAALAPAQADVGVGARRAELLLDLVLAESEGALAHFMDPSFSDLLTEDELILRQGLDELRARRRDDGPAWEALEDLIRSLGGSTRP